MRTGELVIVGYSTKAGRDAAKWAPRFEPNKGTVDPEKQLAQVSEKLARWTAEVQNKVWLGSLSRVVAFRPATSETFEFKSGKSSTGKGASTLLAGAQFGAWLTTTFAKMFRADGEFTDYPLRLFGFEIRRFAKMFATESLSNGIALPHAVWYAAEHRDAWDALLPATEGKDLPLSLPLTMLGIWSQGSPGGADYTLGADPSLDCRVASAVAQRMNLFPEFLNEITLDSLGWPK